MLALIVPTPFEAAPLRRGLRRRSDHQRRLATGWVFSCHRADEIFLVVSGTGGSERFERVVPAVFREEALARVLVAGFCGALDPALERGEILVEREPGSIFFSASDVAATPAEKARLHAETGRAAIDMENGSIWAYAKERGLPLCAIRAVSDTAETTVPQAANHGYDYASGRETPLRMAAYVCRHPGCLPALFRFLWPLQAIRRELCDAVLAEIDDPTPKSRC